MKTHLVQIFSILVLAIFCIETYAQNEDYDEEHIESSLANFSGLSLSTEYYRFSENETAWYFVANGKIEFGDSDYLNLELITTRYSINGSHYNMIGDLNFSYTKNFYSDQFLEPGFQGWSPSLKIIVPTGNPDYVGLFGHWILEPAIYYSWLLKNERFFFSNRWRLFLPVINARDAAEPPKFIRFEPRFGFENNRLWMSITVDNRYIFNMDAFVLFCRGDFGFKINEKNGISAFYTKRIYNTVLFDTYAGVGYYHIF